MAEIIFKIQKQILFFTKHKLKTTTFLKLFPEFKKKKHLVISKVMIIYNYPITEEY